MVIWPRFTNTPRTAPYEWCHSEIANNLNEHRRLNTEKQEVGRSNEFPRCFICNLPTITEKKNQKNCSFEFHQNIFIKIFLPQFCCFHSCTQHTRTHVSYIHNRTRWRQNAKVVGESAPLATDFKISFNRYTTRGNRRYGNPGKEGGRGGGETNNTRTGALVKLPAPVSKLGRCTGKSTAD